MTRKRQPAPRPSTRVPVSEEKLAEIGREAEQRLQRAKRQSDLTAHLKAIAGVYQTYHRVHSNEDAAFRAQLPTEDDWAKASAEFNRWLDGDRRTAPPPRPSFLPIPRLLHELGTERKRIEVELEELERLPGLGTGRRRIEVTLKDAPENEMEDAPENEMEGAKLRILVEQGWSSPQIAAALDPDGVERKTYELKAEKEARQASRVRKRLCKGLREELVRIQKVRMLYEQRVGQISTTTAKTELDRLIAARERNAKRTRRSRLEDERIPILAAIIDIDSIIQSMQAKLDELERRGAWSQGAKRGRSEVGGPRRE